MWWLTAACAAVLVLAPGVAAAQGNAGDLSPPPDSRAAVAATAQGDWHEDAPGKVHRLATSDLPPPYETRSVVNEARVVPRPAGKMPETLGNMAVRLFAEGLSEPRLLRVAPNGDIFVAESRVGRIRVLRPSRDGSKPAEIATFAEHLNQPFGIAFYPPGNHPTYVYVAETDAVLRFSYQSGDLKARGAPEAIVRRSWSEDGHWTRDVAFSPDGKRMFVSVGSASNIAEGMGSEPPGGIESYSATHGFGASWDFEEYRADVLEFDPAGGNMKVFATGLRNCVTIPIEPKTGSLYCVTNERDGLGDNLPPDYVTSLKQGAFYGWPWFYIGDHQDPRHKRARADLAEHITVPDVLLQPHSAPLQGVFYDGSMFPKLRGSMLVALHGSWNRKTRTGAKLIEVLFKDGKPTGGYEDILTGFILSNTEVWGRPVGVAVDRAGAILVSDDAGGTIWRLTKR